jgi:hypothetical protein
MRARITEQAGTELAGWPRARPQRFPHDDAWAWATLMGRAFGIDVLAGDGRPRHDHQVSVEVLPGTPGVECKDKYPFDSASETS